MYYLFITIFALAITLLFCLFIKKCFDILDNSGFFDEWTEEDYYKAMSETTYNEFKFPIY